MPTIVMTGGTSGLGRAAARQLLREPGTRLLLGARSRGLAEAETLPLDLSRLESVRAFAQAVGDRLGETPIDALVLNAGVQIANNEQCTADGFETTFAVNHLAHYLLLRLLLPRLARYATVVITTSNTHDPATNPLASPHHADAERLAHPRQEPRSKCRPFLAGFRAYSCSKLCNLLTARALATSPEANARGLRVVAYNPGFVPETGLHCGSTLYMRILVRVAWLLRAVLRLATAAEAGGVLADLVVGRISAPQGRVYASLVRRELTWPDPSELARKDDVMKALWRDSARLVGLSQQ